MKNKANPIPYTQDELLKLFRYDPDTGNLYWRADKGKLFWGRGRWRRVKIGSDVGVTNESGYRIVSMLGNSYRVHRIIWLMVYGEIREDMEIDHKDRVRDNNRLENLRLVTHQENTFNKSGVKGYYRDRESYRASITVNHRTIYLGSYATKAEARAAYLKAKRKYHQIGRISSEVDPGLAFGAREHSSTPVSCAAPPHGSQTASGRDSWISAEPWF